MSLRVSQKVARLKAIVAERAAWAKPLAQIKRMQQWVLDVEHILDGSWVHAEESVSNATVGQRLDTWRQKLTEHLTDGTLSELEQECLSQFLQVLSNLRPHLVQCYDREAFPRTNNEMERSIRGLKMRYRRISGRKNWNSYLLRYGRCVAYYDWWEQDAAKREQLVQHAARLDRARWHQMRCEAKLAQSEQLKRFRFRHKRQTYLSSLEERWAAAAPTPLLP
ncbi:MAG TPA: transposase [Ktedonobacteraceae bacterium]